MDAPVNFAYGVVSTAPSPASSGLSMVVTNPSDWPPVPFNATVAPAGAGRASVKANGEVVRVTANVAGTWTIERAAEPPNAARTIVAGDEVWAGVTAKMLNDIIAGGPFTGLVVNPAASSLDAGLAVAQTAHGAWVSPGPWAINLNEIVIGSDDIDTGSQGVYGFLKRHNFGGANATGQRIVDVNWLTQTDETDPANAVRYYMASMDVVQADVGDGGTNTGAGALGGYMVANPILFSAAPNAFQNCVMELDVYGTEDATQKYVMALSICPAHVNQGVTLDTAIDIHSLGEYDIGSPAGPAGPGGGFKYALSLNELGNSLPPLSSDGTVLGAYLAALSSLPVANGIDFHNFTFSAYAFRSPGFYVDGTGKVGIGTTPANGFDMKSTSAFLPQSTLWNDTNDANSCYRVFTKSRAGGASHVSDVVGTMLWRATDSASAGQTVATLDCVITAVGAGSVTGYLRTSGDLYLGGALGATGTRVSKGWLADLEVTNAPTVGGVALPTKTSTTTLTNKRVTPRAGTVASSATPTINTDDVDFFSITALAVAITSMTSGLSGTPTTGQKLWIAITGTATRAITWGASFEASTVALPTTTSGTNRLDVGFIWTGSIWRCVAVA